MEKRSLDGNRSRTWSDDALGTTEFLFAHYTDFVFPPHVHETFAIGVIEAGGQRFLPGRASSLVMPAGTLCAINAGVVHEGRPATAEGWRYRMLYPSPALVARILDSEQGGGSDGEWALPHHVIDDKELFSEFESLHLSSQLHETLLERETRLAVFLRRFFGRHGNRSPAVSKVWAKEPRTVRVVRDYLHANVESEVSIGDLARAAGVSDTQVVRSFSAALGMPPHAYLVSLRVERAKALLRRGTPLAIAALDVGFSDQSQLTRHFKRLTGVTPGRFAAETSAPRPR
jgi:AraC-like DNA-binding protein